MNVMSFIVDTYALGTIYEGFDLPLMMTLEVQDSNIRKYIILLDMIFGCLVGYQMIDYHNPFLA